MKKIGILFGQENQFPGALTERINGMNVAGITAEAVAVDRLIQGQPLGYDVVLDRISHDVPFYRAMLKSAALTGTAVLNNPFYLSLEEKFMANVIAERSGVPVPKTALIPSNQLPDDTTDNSFRNLVMPLDWPAIFGHVGFPAFMKPHAGGGWKHVTRVDSPEAFFEAHKQTGQLVMLLQEAIEFESYYRCYCIGGDRVRIMPYEPRNPFHERYAASFDTGAAVLEQIGEHVRTLNRALGYDFNTLEFAVRDGVPYAIDFTNPAPDCNPQSVGTDNFAWVLDAAATMLVERAQRHREGHDNLTWGSLFRTALAGDLVHGMPAGQTVGGDA